MSENLPDIQKVVASIDRTRAQARHTAIILQALTALVVIAVLVFGIVRSNQLQGDIAAANRRLNYQSCQDINTSSRALTGVLNVVLVDTQAALQQAKTSGDAGQIALAQRSYDGTSAFVKQAESTLPHPDCSKF